MDTRLFGPDEIITLNDYPLYDTDAFDSYVRMIRSEEMVPYVPLIPTSSIRFEGLLAERFSTLAREHPRAHYVMLDGSHRTTAFTLARRPIPSVIYRCDADIVEARGAVSSGLIRKSGTLELSFDQNIDELVAHFSAKPWFMTVREKTDRLVRDGFVRSP